MNQENLRQRTVYFDWLRCAATFFVILLHVSASRFGDVSVVSLEWKMFNLYDGVSRWSVAVFVMLSGALFLNKAPDLKKLYGKYMLRIGVAFVAWSAFYVLYERLIQGKSMTTDVVLSHLISGHYHMWYLPMLLGLYAMVPLLKPLTKSKELTAYFLLVSFVLTILLPTLVHILRYTYPSVVPALDSGKSSFALSFGYLFYFVLGYWLAQQDANRLRWPIYILGLLGFASTVILTDILSVRQGQLVTSFYSYFAMNVMLEAMFVFRLVRDVAAKLGNIKAFGVVIGGISKYSFGVYLLHPMVIDLLGRYAGFDVLSFSAVISVPVLAVAVFAVSFVLSWILNHIPIVKTYLV